MSGSAVIGEARNNGSGLARGVIFPNSGFDERPRRLGQGLVTMNDVDDREGALRVNEEAPPRRTNRVAGMI